MPNSIPFYFKLVKNFACFRPPPIRKKSQIVGTAAAQQQQLAVHRNPLQLVQREIAILKKLSHPNVVKLVEVRTNLEEYFYSFSLSFQVLDDPHVSEYIQNSIIYGNYLKTQI
jgi:serine/threonine protein kinase